VGGGFWKQGLKDVIDVWMRLAIVEAIIKKGLFTQKFRGPIRHQTHFTCVVDCFQRENHTQEHERAQDKS